MEPSHGDAGFTPEFAAFLKAWGSHFRNQNPMESFTAYQKVTNQSRDKARCERILRMVALFHRSYDWNREGGSHRCKPSTWLNQGAWMMDPEAIQLWTANDALYERGSSADALKNVRQLRDHGIETPVARAFQRLDNLSLNRSNGQRQGESPSLSSPGVVGQLKGILDGGVHDPKGSGE